MTTWTDETTRLPWAVGAWVLLALALGCGDDSGNGGTAPDDDNMASDAPSGGDGDAGSQPDAASDGDGDGNNSTEVPEGRLTAPLPPGEPIDAPDDEWTWVDFPETRCMNGDPTGLGVKLNPGSDKLLIVIQGGGACFNATTCATAINPEGFAKEALEPFTGVGLLDSQDPGNPFADWNHVFIPYCSGDIFSGSASDGRGYEGRTQQGYRNIREYLTRLVPTFADPARIVLSGYSAGGFAASVNWVQALEAWDGVRIDVLNDSGPPMGPKYLSPCLQQRLAENWAWGEAIPPDCEDCDVESGHVTEPVMKWSIQHTKMYRHALISSTEDATLKFFFAYGLNDCANIDSLIALYPQGLYREGLLALQDTFADHPGARAYIVENTKHVWTTQSPSTVVSEGVTLQDWLEDFLDPDAEWTSVIPPE